MNARQKRFCEEYMKDANATQAAIRAGYSQKTATAIGCNNLRRPEIRQYIADMTAEIRSSNIAEAEEIMAFLSAVMRGEEVEEIPLGIGMGNQKLVEKGIGGKDRVKAAELLGKRYALFTDKVAVDAAIPVVIAGGDDLED